MFENIMQNNQETALATRQQGQMQEQGYYNDPYALPIDPYMQARPSTNWNKQMMDKLFDSALTAGDISKGDYSVMLRSILIDLRRIPNIAPTDKRRLIRDFDDIEALMQCDGTKGRVRSRLRKMVFEIDAQTGDGSSPLNGLTGVSAIITQKSEMSQQVKVPQVQERKKIFGLI